MRQRSRGKGISNREYTPANCRSRYKAISLRIQIGNKENKLQNGHRGVNTYGLLIPSKYPHRMRPYIGLDDQLALSKHYQKIRKIRLPGMRINVQRIRSVVGVGEWGTPDKCIGNPYPSLESPWRTVDRGFGRGIMLWAYGWYCDLISTGACIFATVPVGKTPIGSR